MDAVGKGEGDGMGDGSGERTMLRVGMIPQSVFSAEKRVARSCFGAKFEDPDEVGLGTNHKVWDWWHALFGLPKKPTTPWPRQAQIGFRLLAISNMDL